MDTNGVAKSTGAATEFRVLGPVEAARDGQPVGLGGRRQRALLALLLLEAGRAVSSDRLIDELWNGAPPPGAEGTLRVYVSRLRSVLGENSVFARPPGYVLEVVADRLDANRFERLLREGRDALVRGAAGLAADRLHAALALWRGPALADVSDAGVLALEARRLDELHLVCIEERIEAELALGRHADLVPELERLVADEPLRERLWHQLVTALYRCERQSDALAAYRRARTLLSEELGLEPSEELRALERAVLRHEVPHAAPAQHRHNLPAQLTSFIGRERELGEIERLLREHRLVTLTGTGGAGKTRLALEAASDQLGVWAGGVWLVDLTAQTDPALVPTTVARVLGVVERPDVSALEGVVDHLRPHELLLVLDNCEHLVEACGELADEVLRTCGQVRMLATSRAPLGVPGEVDFAVAPLPTPTDEMPATEAEQFPSVRLFLERARAVRRDLTAGGARVAMVGRICRELDGLPLAIELAAARAKVFSVDEIAARLDDRFRFLRSWRRVADPRHQTLRATIDWSYDLLSEEERALLARLSVFVRGFSLPSAAAVCFGGAEPGASEVLQGLVDSSLVVADDVEGATRYRLLETVRRYGAERLDESGEAEQLHRRHAEHFLEVARHASPDYVQFSAQKQKEGLAVLDSERDNLHAAVQWALASESDLALHLAAQLRHYWLIRGYLRQGLAWLDQALVQSDPDTSPERAAGLAGAALLARLAGDFARAQSFAEEGIAVGRAIGLPRGVITCLNVLTTLAGLEGDYERAARCCDEAVELARSMGSSRLEAVALFILAEAALHTRRYADVQEVGGRALELARSIEDREAMALALNRLGMGAVHENRLEEASTQLLEALAHGMSLGFPAIGAVSCDGLAVVAAAWGDPVRAARLLGAAGALRRASGDLLLPAEAAARDRAFAAIRKTLSEDEAAAAFDAGGRLALDEALAQAQALSASRSGTPV
jgi:predicted ATPase/DNA-binding SARP family transcriptional activator